MALYQDSRGRKKDAEKALTQALQLEPNSQEVLQAVTSFYVREKQTDRAIQAIDKVAGSGKQAFHDELTGVVYMQAGKLEDAEKAFKNALAKDPNRNSSRGYLTADYIQSGRVDEALKELEELIKRNPSEPTAHATKGLLFEKQGNLEEAKRNYTQALELDPNAWDAANNLAYILAEEGRQLDVALRWAQVARKNQPDNPTVADTLGWVYYKLGSYVLARDQIQFAVSKTPDQPILQYHLGMIYLKTNQVSDAQRALEKALRSRENFKEKPQVQAALAQIKR